MYAAGKKIIEPKDSCRWISCRWIFQRLMSMDIYRLEVERFQLKQDFKVMDPWPTKTVENYNFQRRPSRSNSVIKNSMKVL